MLEKKIDQLKNNINIENFEFKEQNSEWNSDISDDSLYNDQFQYALFDEDCYDDVDNSETGKSMY